MTVASALSQVQKTLSDPDPIRDRLPESVEIFCVGGAVRDALLGHAGADRDFVVVGASVDDMLRAGFTPVGKDFPVFLHPVTHDEYALARTERKSGQGYKGFVFNASPDVSLDADLSRRDLTINAIALDASGQLIDPFSGAKDLQNKIFRHVGPAFSEDPVRLLRIARFASRWPDFSLAPETLACCRAMVAARETKALVPERVWQEIQKGLMETCPSRLLTVLQECGAWQDLHSDIVAVQETTKLHLDQAAKNMLDLEGRYALLVLNNGRPQQPDFLKAPRACIDLAALCVKQSADAAACRSDLRSPSPMGLQRTLDWMMAADFIRKPARFDLLLKTLIISGQLNDTEVTTLQSMSDLLSSEQAAMAVAQAAQHAQTAGSDIAAATADARRDLLKRHPIFSRI